MIFKTIIYNKFYYIYNENGGYINNVPYYAIIYISNSNLNIKDGILEIDDEYIKNKIDYLKNVYGYLHKINDNLLDDLLIIFILNKNYHLYNNEELWRRHYLSPSDKEISINEYIIKSIIE